MRAAGRRSFKNFMTRDLPSGDRIRMFEYHYVVSTGNAVVVIEQTVFCYESKKLALPRFEIRPRPSAGRFFMKMGLGRKNFLIDNKDFNLFFKLKIKEEDSRIFEVVEDVTIDVLLKNPGYYMESDNFFFILFKSGKKLPPEEWKDLERFGIDLAESMRY